MDADGWRRICVSFHGASNDLCEALASLARRLCTDYVDPTGIEVLITCRLIPLDKCPGVRPIGIGETPRRIMAAIHVIRTIFTADDCDAVLLVDANNAFNALNRMTALHNIRVLCPAFATILINTYRVPVYLLVAGGGRLVSKEGTTQGDPLAMGMYALGIQPLLNRLEGLARQVWCTDDATGAGSLAQVRDWWSGIVTHGPAYGFEANANKTWLIVKEDDYI